MNVFSKLGAVKERFNYCKLVQNDLMSMYSQTCEHWQPLGPKNSGRCFQVVVVQCHLCYKSSKWSLKIVAVKVRWSLAQIWLYYFPVLNKRMQTNSKLEFWKIVSKFKNEVFIWFPDSTRIRYRCRSPP